MKRCVRIIMDLTVEPTVLREFICKRASNFKVAGFVQAITKYQVKIVACGENQELDQFIDSLYQGYKRIYPQNMTIENFLSAVDYRGVFRLIE